MPEAPNKFLETQARIMQAREEERQREAKAIAVGVTPENAKPIPGAPAPQTQQIFNPASPTVVQSFDRDNNLVGERVIPGDRTMPQRIQKQALPSLAEIADKIENLITDLEESRDAYRNLSLDDYYAPLKAMEAEAARLRSELAKAESDIADFRSNGTPHEGYERHIIDSERDVSVIANLLLAKLTDDAARATFKVPAERLSPETRSDLSIQFDDKLRRFANNFYTRTARAKDLTDVQLTERSVQLVSDLETIVKENL